MIDDKQYFDVSIPVNKAIWKAGQLAENNKLDNDWFISMVNNEKPWDVKLKEPWEQTIGTTYPGDRNTPVILYGKIVTPAIIGNILYGYAGAAAGYPDTILYGAGGMVQQGGLTSEAFKKAFSDGPPYWGDTKEDHDAIEYGINWYKKR